MSGPSAALFSSRKAVVLSLQAVVSCGLLWLLLVRFDFEHALQVVRGADRRFVLAGFCLAPLVILLMAVRFRAVLTKGGLSLPWLRSLSIVWGGQFWNCFLPGSTGGDVYRVAALWRAFPDRKSNALFAIFADRIAATAVLAVGALFGMAVLPVASIIQLFRLPDLGGLAVIGLAGVVVIGGGILLFPRSRNGVKILFGELVRKLWVAKIFFSPDFALGSILILSVVVHLLNFSVFFCFARAVGLSITFGQACVMLPMVLLLLIIPVSINGHGVREVLFVIFLHSFKIEPIGGALAETVLAISVIGLSSDLFLGLIGGAIVLGSHQTEPTQCSTRPIVR